MSFPSKAPDVENGWLGGELEPFHQWCEARQPLPDQSVFQVKETPQGVFFSLTPALANLLETAAPHRLSVVNASDGAAKARVYLGYVGGVKADSSMADPTDSPPFIITIGSAGTFYVYADVTLSYATSTGAWSVTGCEVAVASSLPAVTATHGYAPLATLTATATGVTSITQIASSDLSYVRRGNATVYADEYRYV